MKIETKSLVHQKVKRLTFALACSIATLLGTSFSASAQAPSSPPGWTPEGSQPYYQPNPYVRVDSGKRNNVFYVGDAISFKLSQASVTKYEVRNYNGDVVASGSVSGTVIAPAVTQPGWYKLYLHGTTNAGGDWGDSVGGTNFCIFRNDPNFPPMPPPPSHMVPASLKTTRVDAYIDFKSPSYGANAINPWPAAPLPAQGFSVSWTGFVQPRYSDSYMFVTNSDDGVRVTINLTPYDGSTATTTADNGTKVIDDLQSQGYGEHRGNLITLQAGKKYAIRMDYVQGGDNSMAQLKWRGNSQADEVIPQDRLYSTTASADSGSGGDGLTGKYYDDTTYESADGGQDTTLQSVLASGPERYAADVTTAQTTADSIAAIDHDIAIAKQLYVGRDAARPRDLLIAFSNGTSTAKDGSASPDATAQMARVKQVVEHFKNDVKYWEARNEPNYGASGAGFATNEMIPFYNLVKGVNSNLKVIGPGVVEIAGMLNWVEDFFKAGGAGAIDAFSFHPYNGVNGDLNLARKSMDALQSLLTRYNLGSVEKWQTEQGYMAAVYGVYQPRLQGRWTMMQKMVYEQYGIPKEHDHLWHDKVTDWAHPMNTETADGSLNPAGPLMRVWSEELFGTSFSRKLDFGNPGNELLIGNVFQSPAGATPTKSVVALMSSGATDLSATLQLSSNSPVKVVSAFGVTQTLTPSNNRLTIPVPEIPVYVELAQGQSADVVPMNFGTNLTSILGTTAFSPSDNPSDPASKVINGNLEATYYGPSVWHSNEITVTSGTPVLFEVRLPSPQSVNRVVIHSAVPWQQRGSILDYDLQYDNNGTWVTIPSAHTTEPTKTFKYGTPATRTKVDQFYSDRSVFMNSFAPVTTSKIRLVANDMTYGGGATTDSVDAGGQTSGKLQGPEQTDPKKQPWIADRQLFLSEIELYSDAPPTAPNPPVLTARFNPVADHDMVAGGASMVGGKFQGSNDNSNWTDLATISQAPPSAQWSQVSIGATMYRYLRFLQAPSVGNRVLNELAFYNGSVKILGTGIGTPGVAPNTPADRNFQAALDGDTTTYFDGPTNGGNYVGIDTGPAATPTPTPTPANPDGTPYGGTARTLPGVVQAEDFNSGGEGVAYHDTSAGNTGGAYRTAEDVDLENCSDVGGGSNIGWVDGGEWTKYAVNVQSAGNYDITLRVASPLSGKSLHIEMNGVNKTGSVSVPNTGGWQTWANVTIPAVSLSAGLQTMKVVMDTDGLNLNFVKVAAPTVPTSTSLKARFYPRSGAADRMTGGKFQGSNDNSAWTDLATLSVQPTNNAWSEVQLGTSLYRYLRYVSPGGSYGNIAELQFYNNTTLLTGTGVGTSGSFGNYGNTFDKALDGDITTFYDAASSNGGFVGIDRGP